MPVHAPRNVGLLDILLVYRLLIGIIVQQFVNATLAFLYHCMLYNYKLLFLFKRCPYVCLVVKYLVLIYCFNI